MITADCDDDANKRFSEIANWLTAAGYAPPAKQGDVVPKQALPIDFGLMVLLIPPTKHAGCLETLLYPAAANKWSALVPCVDNYWTCVSPIGGTVRTANQESKIKMRALLAAAKPKNPNLSLVKLWDDPAMRLPLDDPAFIPIIDAVKMFLSSV